MATKSELITSRQAETVAKSFLGGRVAADQIVLMPPRFAKLYADTGRPSIPPERLSRALLLQILCTVQSERVLERAKPYLSDEHGTLIEV